MAPGFHGLPDAGEVTTLLLGLAAKGKEALVDTTQDVRAYATAAAAIQAPRQGRGVAQCSPNVSDANR